MNENKNLSVDAILEQTKLFIEEFRVKENKKIWTHFTKQDNEANVCPFCGKMPLVWNCGIDKKLVRCITDGCPMSESSIDMYLEVWNKRSREHFLMDEIQRLKLALKEAGAL